MQRRYTATITKSTNSSNISKDAVLAKYRQQTMVLRKLKWNYITHRYYDTIQYKIRRYTGTIQEYK